MCGSSDQDPFYWYQNGTKDNKQHDHSNLTIFVKSPEDGGSYTCINGKGIKHVSVDLTVTGEVPTQ